MQKIKKGLILVFVLSVMTGFFCVPGVYAGVPQMINYQGSLTDKNGTPVPNGNYSIEFKIYDVASGGTALWSEKWDTTTSQIPVVGGNFNVMLGFQSPIPAAFFADHPVTYLGVKVGTDSEMLPRQQITSVGYAFTAGNGVPKGGVIMWSGAIDQIPAGWALCDGVERTRSDGTKVTPPDLRDRFVVGAGGGYAVAATGGNSSINIAHAHTMNHTHTYEGTVSTHAGTPTGGSSGAIKATAHNHTYSGTTSNVSVGNTGSAGNASQDIRPPYYAMAYIMKL